METERCIHCGEKAEAETRYRLLGRMTHFYCTNTDCDQQGPWKPTKKEALQTWNLIQYQLTYYGEAVSNLQKLHKDITNLIAESQGVTGLHLNGDVAFWSEITPGGHLEEWLLSLDDTEKFLKKIQES